MFVEFFVGKQVFHIQVHPVTPIVMRIGRNIDLFLVRVMASYVFIARHPVLNGQYA